MIKVYAFATPNSVRIPIALEELGLPYEIQAINVRNGEQKDPAYLAVNPNGKVPAIVDPDGPNGQPFTLTESGAILVYLAEKTGRLLPADRFARARAVEQVFFHLTAIGPAFGQLGFFKRQAAEQNPLRDQPFPDRGQAGPGCPGRRPGQIGIRRGRRLLHCGHRPLRLAVAA